MHARMPERSLTRALTATTGIIDLASIMVGVLVIGILGGVIAAAVFTVIPWTQDRAAISDLSNVRVAQSIANVRDRTYEDSADLVANAYMAEPPTAAGSTAPLFATDVNADGTCYVGAAISTSGNIYFVTSRSPDPVEYSGNLSATDWCVPLADVLHVIKPTIPASS